MTAIATVVIALVVKATISPRVSGEQENEGLDRTEHRENANPMEP